MVLRENAVTKSTRVEGLHKIFRTDEALKPEEISQLLGIEVDIDQSISVKSKNRDFSSFQFALIWILSVMFAVSGILFYMYLYKIGLFHPSFAYSYS
jgi:hypothetical protein